MPADLAVRADEQLSLVFEHLLENAVTHTNDTTPTIEVSVRSAGVCVNVTDTGPGLPEHQQILLETGAIGEIDNP